MLMLVTFFGVARRCGEGWLVSQSMIHTVVGYRYFYLLAKAWFCCSEPRSELSGDPSRLTT